MIGSCGHWLKECVRVKLCQGERVLVTSEQTAFACLFVFSILASPLLVLLQSTAVPLHFSLCARYTNSGLSHKCTAVQFYATTLHTKSAPWHKCRNCSLSLYIFIYLHNFHWIYSQEMTFSHCFLCRF